jgi:hypothetical protein
MPLAPPSPDQKVKVFTQEGHTTQKGEDCSMTFPRKKMAPVGVVVIDPRETRLSPWCLNLGHGRGYGLSTAPAAAL